MNELEHSTSPYLRQFAESEIEWRAYSEDVFKEARRARKNVHVSVGRFQHPNTVMETAFYNDKQVALFFNQSFINIKLDGDEFPDVERALLLQYESSIATTVGLTNGWYPVSVIVNPESRISNVRTGSTVEDLQEHQQGKIRLPLPSERTSSNEDAEQEDSNIPAAQLIFEGKLRIKPKSFSTFTEPHDRMLLNRQDILMLAQNKLDLRLPMLGLWAKQLLEFWLLDEELKPERSQSLDLVLVSLTQWARSGDFDHVQGGVFHDQRWRFPEDSPMAKTLAANAWALELLTDALTVTSDTLLQFMAEQLIECVNEQFTTESGLCVASVVNEGNSQGTLQRRKVKSLLTEDEYLVIGTLFGLDRRPNRTGQWIPIRQGSWRSVVDQLFFTADECETLFAQGMSKIKLEETRNAVYLKDERILFRPNARLAYSLFRAGRALGNLKYVDQALAIAHQLALSQSSGDTKPDLGIDSIRTLLDLALLIRIINLALEEKWSSQLALKLVELISDASLDSYLVDGKARASEVDEFGVLYALPSADRAAEPNALPIVRQAMQTVGVLYRNTKALQIADQIVGTAVAVADRIEERIDGSSTLEAFKHLLGEVCVVIRGPDQLLDEWVEALRKDRNPLVHIYAIPYSESEALPPFLPRMMLAEEKERVAGYLVQREEMLDPIYDLEEMLGVVQRLTGHAKQLSE